MVEVPVPHHEQLTSSPLRERLAAKNRPLWEQNRPKPLPIQMETRYPQELWKNLVMERREPQEIKKRTIDEKVIEHIHGYVSSLADDVSLRDVSNLPPELGLHPLTHELSREERGSFVRMMRRAADNGINDVGALRTMSDEGIKREYIPGGKRVRGVTPVEVRICKAVFGPSPEKED